MTDRHIILVDCSGFAYRSFHSQPALRRQEDGEPTGAVLGFMSLIWKMLGHAQADMPTHGAAVFDHRSATFRHKLFPAYKGGRDPARSLELEKQLPLMRPVAEVLGLHPIEAKGFEADDTIATLARLAQEAGMRVSIVSSDKDFGQNVVDGHCEIIDPMSRLRNPDASPRRLEADVAKKFGVPPAQVPDVQALAGDSADGIPGLPTCGLDTAGRLVRRWGSLEAVLDNADAIRFPKVRAALGRRWDVRVAETGRPWLVPAAKASKTAKTGADWCRLFLKLTTLRTDVPLKVDFAAMEYRFPVKADLVRVVKALDPAARIEALFGLDLQKEGRVMPALASADGWWAEELLHPGQKLPEVPACGFYRARLVMGGPWVPARVWREAATEGQEVLRCEVAGKLRDAYQMFPTLARHPITEKEFNFQTADYAHAKAFRPKSPQANPTMPIDLSKQPSPTNPRAKRSQS